MVNLEFKIDQKIREIINQYAKLIETGGKISARIYAKRFIDAFYSI